MGVFEWKMRRKLIAAAALSLAALTAWVAAPALSLTPYAPAAEDFERGLPAAKRIAAQRASLPRDPAVEAPRWISPPVRAQYEFDLVGVAREMRPLELRVRDDGGEWSEWVEQADGTPVYAGGAREVQVRASFRPAGELHFVNVSGTAGGAAERLLSSAREAVNSAFLAVASTPLAAALAPRPKVVKRAGWGADATEGGCPPRGPAEYGSVGAAVVHHTVNANTYTREEAAGIVLGICRFQVFGNGWNDIGYNALVDRFGTLYEGRAGGLKQPVVGAQAQGFNDQTTSIASIGDHTGEGIAKKARGSVTRFLSWKLAMNRALPATGLVTLASGGGSESRYPEGTQVTVPRVIGHGDLGLTACPGALLAPQVPTIRKGVQKRVKRYAKRRKAKRSRAGGAQPAR